jgi:hypothetical protein
MLRIILPYGLISGLFVIALMIASIKLLDDHSDASMVVGYLIMLVGLSSILVATKQYRDQTLGGVIRFWPAFGLGLGIALAATVAYVVVWEVYVALTHYTFMDDYIAQQLAAKRAAGVTGEAYAKLVAQMDSMRAMYANPFLRLLMTAAEIFPVGFLVALVSAALVRNPRFLPARSRALPA